MNSQRLSCSVLFESWWLTFARGRVRIRIRIRKRIAATMVHSVQRVFGEGLKNNHAKVDGLSKRKRQIATLWLGNFQIDLRCHMMEAYFDPGRSGTKGL